MYFPETLYIIHLRAEVNIIKTSKKEESYTIDDIYALPDGERAELIDGKIYYMAPPNTRHQRLVMDLSYQIKDYIRQNKGECEVFPAPFAVFLNENYVEPDISVICDKNQILVYRFEQETMEEYSFGEDVPVGIYEGFSIRVE